MLLSTAPVQKKRSKKRSADSDDDGDEEESSKKTKKRKRGAEKEDKKKRKPAAKSAVSIKLQPRDCDLHNSLFSLQLSFSGLTPFPFDSLSFLLDCSTSTTWTRRDPSTSPSTPSSRDR